MELIQMRNAYRAALENLHTTAAIDVFYKQLLKVFFQMEPTVLGLEPKMQLLPAQVQQLERALKALKEHQPLQYITRQTSFYGLLLHVTPDTLIPRPETEELIDCIADEWKNAPPKSIVDIGTGSGCIALALKKMFPQTTLIGIDKSEEALKVAKANAAQLHLEVEWKQQDINALAPLSDLDIIVSNPPYVHPNEEIAPNVLNYEPHQALFSPAEAPLYFYEKIASFGRNALHDSGKIYFEINPLDAEALEEYMLRLGYKNVEIKKDIFGKLRFLSASKQ